MHTAENRYTSNRLRLQLRGGRTGRCLCPSKDHRGGRRLTERKGNQNPATFPWGTQSAFVSVCRGQSSFRHGRLPCETLCKPKSKLLTQHSSHRVIIASSLEEWETSWSLFTHSSIVYQVPTKCQAVFQELVIQQTKQIKILAFLWVHRRQ